ncbi:MAG: hypothetical protein HOP04_02270 [Methylophilaceae bacterium]|nr:hypothetical protein [Methylophilaceae bacterium]
MAIIHIFKAGKHIDSSGGTTTFSENDLATTAMIYNMSQHQAPLVLGHPKDDQPAYGWVDSLSHNVHGLFAHISKISPALYAAVKNGSYRNVSASFHSPYAKENPAKGGWFLKHVGMLGAMPPAVKGLARVEFNERVDGNFIPLDFTDFVDFPARHLQAEIEHAEMNTSLALQENPWEKTPVVAFEEADGYRVAPEQLRLYHAALRYQSAHNTSFIEAVKFVSEVA